MSNCSICLSQSIDPVSGSCIHTFCRSCITRWMESNNSCPNCRKEINLLNCLPFTEGSLINNIGIKNIHKYTMMYSDGINISKGTTPLLTLKEIEYIGNLCGFKVDKKMSFPNNQEIICVLRHNIITIGKKVNINDNKYKIIDGIAIVRDNRTTFPISPNIREYNHFPDNIYYKLVI